VKEVVHIDTVNALEHKLGIQYPADFKDILTKYSSGLLMGWQVTDDDEPQGEFRNIFCGASGVSEHKQNPFLWDFDKLEEVYKDYIGWITDCYNDPTDSYGKHYYNKVPFISVLNGDLIAFDTNGQVVYLSHDDGPLHGEKLADNFIEFITLWSNLGCVGTESEQFAVFYDKDNEKLMSDGPKIDRWKKWLMQRN
jgi:hypothetical protein